MGSMMAVREMILWSAIIFVIVSSTHISSEEENNGVCNTTINITQSKTVSHKEKRTFASRLAEFVMTWKWQPKTYTANKTILANVSLTVQTCCEGYKNISAPCEPQCLPTCTNAYCIIDGSLTEATSKLSASRFVRNISGNPLIERMECDSKCRSQLNSSAVGRISLGKDVYYLLPIDSSCNSMGMHSVTRNKQNSIIIGAVIGILFLLMVACTVYLIWRKRNTRNKVTDEPTQRMFENYMKENIIYS